MQSKRYLVLEDGSFYEGYRLGSDNLTVGGESIHIRQPAFPFPR